MSQYYIMYFKAISILSKFKNTIQKFYKNLEYLLIKALDNNKNHNKKVTIVIAKYEGILF